MKDDEESTRFSKKYPACIMENVFHQSDCAVNAKLPGDCTCTPRLVNVEEYDEWDLEDGDLLLIEDGKPVAVLWEGEK